MKLRAAPVGIVVAGLLLATLPYLKLPRNHEIQK